MSESPSRRKKGKNSIRLVVAEGGEVADKLDRATQGNQQHVSLFTQHAVKYAKLENKGNESTSMDSNSLLSQTGLTPLGSHHALSGISSDSYGLSAQPLIPKISRFRDLLKSSIEKEVQQKSPISDHSSGNSRKTSKTNRELINKSSQETNADVNSSLQSPLAIYALHGTNSVLSKKTGFSKVSTRRIPGSPRTMPKVKPKKVLTPTQISPTAAGLPPMKVHKSLQPLPGVLLASSYDTETTEETTVGDFTKLETCFINIQKTAIQKENEGSLAPRVISEPKIHLKDAENAMRVESHPASEELANAIQIGLNQQVDHSKFVSVEETDAMFERYRTIHNYKKDAISIAIPKAGVDFRTAYGELSPSSANNFYVPSSIVVKDKTVVTESIIPKAPDAKSPTNPRILAKSTIFANAMDTSGLQVGGEKKKYRMDESISVSQARETKLAKRPNKNLNSADDMNVDHESFDDASELNGLAAESVILKPRIIGVSIVKARQKKTEVPVKKMLVLKNLFPDIASSPEPLEDNDFEQSDHHGSSDDEFPDQLQEEGPTLALEGKKAITKMDPAYKGLGQSGFGLPGDWNPSPLHFKIQFRPSSRSQNRPRSSQESNRKNVEGPSEAVDPPVLSNNPESKLVGESIAESKLSQDVKHVTVSAMLDTAVKLEESTHVLPKETSGKSRQPSHNDSEHIRVQELANTDTFTLINTDKTIDKSILNHDADSNSVIKSQGMLETRQDTETPSDITEKSSLSIVSDIIKDSEAEFVITEDIFESSDEKADIAIENKEPETIVPAEAASFIQDESVANDESPNVQQQNLKSRLAKERLRGLLEAPRPNSPSNYYAYKRQIFELDRDRISLPRNKIDQDPLLAIQELLLMDRTFDLVASNEVLAPILPSLSKSQNIQIIQKKAGNIKTAKSSTASTFSIAMNNLSASSRPQLSDTRPNSGNALKNMLLYGKVNSNKVEKPSPVMENLKSSLYWTHFSLYMTVHDVKHRELVLSPAERERYLTINDAEYFQPQKLINRMKDAGYVNPIPNPTIKEELDFLTSRIEGDSTPIPSLMRHRALLYMFLENYEDALFDLNNSITFDPYFMDAYWYRYQIYCLEMNLDLALKDLDTLCEQSKNQFAILDVKARIYEAIDMRKLAIVNYSTCIKLKPKSWDAYFHRACLLDAENDFTYAKEDFKAVKDIEPTVEHALYKLALYNFQSQIWSESIRYWTMLIEYDSENGRAFLYRARAFAYLTKWNEAAQDMLRAIRIMPDDYSVYYHRGCLIKEKNPAKAMLDFSISILLRDSVLNIESYCQRASLYLKEGNHMRAIDDYMKVLSLDPTRYVAALNLGILFAKYTSNDEESLKYFNHAIQSNPTYGKSYICRGDFYDKIHSLPSRMTAHKKKINYLLLAIRDHSRAIHLNPTDHMLYLYRGRLLLKQGKIKDATDDFKAAFELNTAIAQTFIQRALILSFQGKYAQIVEEFKASHDKLMCRNPTLMLIVAKAKMKTQDFAGALEQLENAASYRKRDPNIFLQRGICYQNIREYALATKEFSVSISLDPTFVKAYFHRGVSKLYQRSIKGLNDLNKAIELKPKYFEAYMMRSSFYHEVQMFEESISDASMAITLESMSLRAYLLRGSSYTKTRRDKEALQDFAKAIQMDPACHFAYYNRAFIHQLQNKPNEAIIDYSITLMLNDDWNAYRNRGLVYWHSGDHENALIDFFTARKFFPCDMHLQIMLGACFQKLGRIKESIETFTAAIIQNPQAREPLVARGSVYASNNDFKRARADFSRVIHMFPSNAEAYLKLADASFKAKYPKLAWILFSSAISLNPHFMDGFVGRSAVLSAIGDNFAALIDTARALELTPGNVDLLANRGALNERAQDITAALQSYKEALGFNPKHSLSHLNIGNLYFNQKRYEDAVSHYTMSIDTQESANAHINRGITFLRLDRVDLAMEDFDRACKADSGLAEAFFNRGQCHLLQGQNDDGEADIKHAYSLAPDSEICGLTFGNLIGRDNLRRTDAMRNFAKHIQV